MTQSISAATFAVILASALAPAQALAEPASKPASTGTLMVSASGFADDTGQAVIALYRRGEHWLDVRKAFRIRTLAINADHRAVTAVFRDVPFDDYAISVIHDRNQNGRMDMRWLPFPEPKEPSGVSNNRMRTGKPQYSKAKFAFDRTLMSVRIQVQ
jgi:uncharacterized protein (DUF2141 family)